MFAAAQNLQIWYLLTWICGGGVIVGNTWRNDDVVMVILEIRFIVYKEIEEIEEIEEKSEICSMFNHTALLNMLHLSLCM